MKFLFYQRTLYLFCCLIFSTSFSYGVLNSTETAKLDEYTLTVQNIHEMLERSSGSINIDIVKNYGEKAIYPLLHLGSVVHSTDELKIVNLTLEKIWNEHTMIPILIKGLGYDDFEVRKFSSYYLTTLGTKAIKPLIKALKNSNWRTRANAAISLGRIGDPKAISKIQKLLKDKNRDVNLRAQWALHELEEKELKDDPSYIFFSNRAPGFFFVPFESLHDITNNLENLSRKIDGRPDIDKPKWWETDLILLCAHQQIILFYQSVIWDIRANDSQQIFEMTFGNLITYFSALPANQRMTSLDTLKNFRASCIKHWKNSPKKTRNKDIRKCIELLKPQINYSCDVLAKAYDIKQTSGAIKDFLMAAEELDHLVNVTSIQSDYYLSAKDILSKLHIDELSSYLGKFQSFILEYKDLHNKLAKICGDSNPDILSFEMAVKKLNEETNDLGEMPKHLRWYLCKQPLSCD